MPNGSNCRGCPYRAARPGAEVLGLVRHSAVRKAPPNWGRLVSQAGAAEVRRGASVEYQGNRGSAERQTKHPGGIRHFRGTVRRSGVRTRIYGGRVGSGDSQDERPTAGEGGGSSLRLRSEALGSKGEADAAGLGAGSSAYSSHARPVPRWGRTGDMLARVWPGARAPVRTQSRIRGSQREFKLPAKRGRAGGNYARPRERRSGGVLAKTWRSRIRRCSFR